MSYRPGRHGLVSAPLGATRPDFAGRNLLEFCRPWSETTVPRSVLAFLPYKVSVGPRSSGDVARTVAARLSNEELL